MTPQTSHLEPEQIDALLAGGLDDAERTAASAHLAECPTCTAALTAATAADRKVRTMLTPAHPAAGFEDRLIHAVRGARSRRLVAPPTVRRAALAAAAVLVVAGTGAIGTHALNGDGFPWTAHPAQQASLSSLRQIGQAVQLDAKDAPASAAAAQPSAGEALESAITPQILSPGNRSLGWGRPVLKQALPPSPAPAGAPGFRPADMSGTESNSLDESRNAPQVETYVKARAGRDNVVADSVAEGVPSVPPGSASGSVNISVASPVASPVAVVPGPPVPLPPTPAPPQPPATSPATAMVIRNGTMVFEVDRFDSAVATLTKIVQQAGGFVATTNSDTLPNGKVKGLVVLRVPPDRLDALVLSLRALGDLKSQQITADDVTKQYTDLQAELTADRAMQDRLLELVKSANGQIKDLLAVEKELAVWKGKIEHAEGEIRYYDNLVSMSTLSITLIERDIHQPATTIETETADLGVESDDVERGYAAATAAIRDAHGSIVSSELKRYDAGQLAAHVVADIPADAAGAVIDRLKQLGRVARLQVSVQQTHGDDGSVAPAETDRASTTAPAPQQHPTRLLLSLYNLANVAPRRTTTMTLAAADVGTASASMVEAVAKLGGRVVSSTVNRDDPNQATAALTLEVPPAQLAAMTEDIGALGEVLKTSAADNPDTANTTEFKQGISLQLVSLASVNPRESIQQGLGCGDVPAAYHRILDAATAAGATIHTAQLDESDPQNITGSLEFDLLRAKSAAVDAAIAAAGQTISRQSTRSPADANSVDSKVGLHLTLSQADRLAPRESTTLQLQVTDPAAASADAQAAALATGGQVSGATVSKDAAGHSTAKLSIDLPMGQSAALLSQLRTGGSVVAIDASSDSKAPQGPLARAHVDVTWTTANTLVADNSGLLATLRAGLATSIAGLLWSLQILVVGLCFVVPWAAVVWAGRRVWVRVKSP